MLFSWQQSGGRNRRLGYAEPIARKSWGRLRFARLLDLFIFSLKTSFKSEPLEWFQHNYFMGETIVFISNQLHARSIEKYYHHYENSENSQ